MKLISVVFDNILSFLRFQNIGVKLKGLLTSVDNIMVELPDSLHAEVSFPVQNFKIN